jgi:hypothetical protein
VGELYVFRGLQSTERKLIYISLVGIAICLYLLQFYNFSNLNSAKLEREIGVISEAQSDIRIKNYAQSFWQSAKNNQKVREGDKVYTGEKSFAMIDLKNESKIELKENSLVEFKKLNNMNIADLEEGEYRVAIVKNLKLAVQGQIADIEGQSEIILKVSKNKTFSVETLQGAPTIQYQSKVYSPTKEAPSTIEIKAPLSNTSQQNSAIADDQDAARDPSNTEDLSAQEESQQDVAVQVNAESKNFNYNVKMYDVYDRDGQQLKLKPPGRTLVRFAVPLEILTFDPAKEIFIDYSNNADLSNNRQYATDTLDRRLAQVFLGDNYWRASQNKQDWSPTGHFVVRAVTLPSSQVKVQLNETLLYLKNGTAEVDVQLSTNIDANGYLVESSNTTVFDRKSTTHWSYENKLHLQFNRAGTYYYRFRAVDEDLRLGAWSKVTPIEVLQLAPLKAPQFVRSEYTTNSDENLLLSWSNPDQLEKFKIAITDAKDKTILEKTISNPSFEWTPRNPGTYRAEIRSVDSQNRVSEPGLAAVIVKAAIIRLSKLTDSFKRRAKGNKSEDEDAGNETQDKSRKTASKGDDAKDVEIRTQFPVIKLGYNADFVLSRLTFSTNYYDIVYSPVLSASSELPVATPGLQVAALGWRGHHGGELMVQKNLSSNEPGAADFYSAEARYHYRFYDHKDRADLVGFHISPYIGYELYSNSNSVFFVSKYNMAKLGLFFELPIMQSWTMGLTAAYGTGDSLTKYEGLFDVSYFFKKQWTMGLGLKSSVMFGTTSQFPIYPDYREGYSLGQFNLRYFF